MPPEVEQTIGGMDSALVMIMPTWRGRLAGEVGSSPLASKLLKRSGRDRGRAVVQLRRENKKALDEWRMVN